MIMSIQQLKLSPTVERTLKQLGEQTGVYAVEVVKSVLAQHTEYAEKIPRLALISGRDAQYHPVDDWLAEVPSLYEPGLVPELHGNERIINSPGCHNGRNEVGQEGSLSEVFVNAWGETEP
jgi:hypothetical protein